MPMIAFIGVRISWLMLARNSLLARLADSAAARASRSSRACSALSSAIAPKADSVRKISRSRSS